MAGVICDFTLPSEKTFRTHSVNRNESVSQITSAMSHPDYRLY